jgi:hypothetical protein
LAALDGEANWLSLHVLVDEDWQGSPRIGVGLSTGSSLPTKIAGSSHGGWRQRTSRR